ncbi:hypothetical protein D3C80_283990 [compost metagenome]
MQPCEAVCHRHGDCAMQALTQKVVVALALDLRAQPRIKFKLLQRSHHIVIYAQLKSTDDQRTFILVHNQNDRHKPCALDCTHLRAEP